MKGLTKFLMGSFLFVICISSTYSQAYFTNVKVEPRWVPDPDVQAGSIIVKGSDNTSRWLQIDVDYTAILPKENEKNKDAKLKWMDNVVIKYDVLLPVSTKKSTTPPAVLSGQIQYWSIPMDGKVHHAQAFIHPKIIKRYAQPNLKMRKNDLKDFCILVTLLVNDTPVGMGFYKTRDIPTRNAAQTKMSKALGFIKTVKGKDLVFGRDITPWGVLNTGYYELIKRKK